MARSQSPPAKRSRRMAEDDREVRRSGGRRGDDERGGGRDRSRGRDDERDRSRDRNRAEREERMRVDTDSDRDRDRTREKERVRSKRDERDSTPPRRKDGDRDKDKDGDREHELSPNRRKRPSPPRDGSIERGRNGHDEVSEVTAPAGSVKEPKDESIMLMEAAEAALEESEKAKEKEKASFEYSGKLAAETNKVNGIALQFTEPPEARQPTVRWRLYVFKDGEPLKEPLYIHRQSCYLFGRERKIADIPTDHPSCSKQHAVIQYRLAEKIEADGMSSNKIRPYLMDLGSTNGTYLNGERIESQRYYELFEKDTVRFGNSSREYVLLHENSAA